MPKTAIEELEFLEAGASSVTGVQGFNDIVGKAYTMGWLSRRNSTNNPFFNPASVHYRALPREEMRRQAVNAAYWRGADDYNYYELFCTTDD